MTDITLDNLNEQQLEAIDLAIKWYKDYQSGLTTRQYFFLSGVAGSGKTTVAKFIADGCCGFNNAIFMAPTGKAASRLKAKGCRNAQTMHHFIYNFAGENDEGELIFSSKDSLEVQPKLIVLDEGSMINRYDAQNILDHKIPLLVLGDIYQVPPVRGAAFFNKDNMDYDLTKIERTAENSNIVKASMVIRNGYSLPLREYADVMIRDGNPPSKLLTEYAANENQIICSRNATRQSFNAMIRDLLGHTGNMPSMGEKLVCTFNQHKYDFMNGEQCILLGLEELPAYAMDNNDLPTILIANVLSLTDNRQRRVKFNPESFSTDAERRMEALTHVGGFDYGYLLTVHKSQGSEWANVMVLDEILPQVPYRFMMYTAVTRAMEKLIVYRK